MPAGEFNHLGNLCFRHLERKNATNAHAMAVDMQHHIHGFLAVQAESLPDFCQAALAAEENDERTVVTAGGKQFSIQRFCPHQGADLTQAWIEGGRYLTCPLHRWQFDLENGGRCTTNATWPTCRS